MKNPLSPPDPMRAGTSSILTGEAGVVNQLPPLSLFIVRQAGSGPFFVALTDRSLILAGESVIMTPGGATTT
jgi:hypothetical protein